MAINIGGKKAAPKSTTPPETTDLDQLGGTAHPTPPEQPAEPDTPPPAAGQAAPAPGNTPQAPGHQTQASFLITGAQQTNQVQQVKSVQELRSKLRGGAREFFLQPGEFAKLYFLDGKLLGEGVFDTPMIATHMLQIGGDWVKFVCNTHTEGNCVVCDSNADGSQPNTLQVFSVINTMPYTIKNGPNRGKTMPARLQLFPATMKVREKLMKRAQNHGGQLAGSLYTFTRSSKTDPRTGEDIEFIQEVPMQSVIQKYPMLHSVYDPQAKGYKDAPTAVYDYAKVYPVLTNAEIASLRPDLASLAGFSGGYAPVAQPTSGFGADPTGELDDEVPF